jgi:acyl-CoA synthetase (AMP-forming)/AMP-acid ligase II
MPATLPDLVERLRTHPVDHGVAPTDAGGTTLVAWRTLHDMAMERAAAIHAHGVGSGDRVVLCLTGETATLATFLGLLHLGAVPVSIAAAPFGQAQDARRAFLGELFESTAARWAIAQPETALAPAAVGRIARDATAPGVRVPATRPAPEDLALVQFSSGSTARPKGIRLTHRTLSANLALVAQAGNRHSTETLSSWVPLSHDMGLVGVWLSSLALGVRRLRLLDPMQFLMRPLSWLEALAADRARISVCPNFALDHCVRGKARWKGPAPDLACLEALLVGAESVRPTSLARFERAIRAWGLRPDVLTPVYGLAEATLIVTAHETGTPVVTRRIDGTEVVSVGRALGDFKIRIDGAPTSDAPGEILLRGESISPGLLDPAGDGGMFRDGWLRTGDLGVLDECGRLYVTGRVKDLLIVDGRNFYAHDLSAAAEDLPFVRPGRTHAFTALVGSRKRVVLLVVPRGRVGVGEVETIRRRVLARCGLGIDDVLFVRRLPRTASGKVRRHACEAIYHGARRTTPA